MIRQCSHIGKHIYFLLFINFVNWNSRSYYNECEHWAVLVYTCTCTLRFGRLCSPTSHSRQLHVSWDEHEHWLVGASWSRTHQWRGVRQRRPVVVVSERDVTEVVLPCQTRRPVRQVPQLVRQSTRSQPHLLRTRSVSCNFWHPETLTLRAERQSARMSKITNDSGLNPVWHRIF